MIKKILFFLIILSAITLVVAYFFGSSILSKSVKTGVETFGPGITQTSIRLDEVHLSILSGNGALSGLYVGNPEGFNSENIFALSQIDVDINPKSIFSDRIVINEIYIRKPQISYEKSLRSSNFKELLKNIEGGSDRSDRAPSEEEIASKDESTKKVLIKKLVIEDGAIFVGILGIGTTVPLPRIEISDIGKGDEKSDVASILTRILTEVFQLIIPAVQGETDSGKTNINEAINSILEPGEDAIKQVNERINSLIN